MRIIEIKDFESFDVFKEFCETLEKGGFVLNIKNGRYESKDKFTGNDTNRFAGKVHIYFRNERITK